jgi:hypothetical protein
VRRGRRSGNRRRGSRCGSSRSRWTGHSGAWYRWCRHSGRPGNRDRGRSRGRRGLGRLGSQRLGSRRLGSRRLSSRRLGSRSLGTARRGRGHGFGSRHGTGLSGPAHGEHRAAHRTPRADAGLGNLGRVHPIHGGAIRTGDVHLALTTVPGSSNPDGPRRRFPAGDRPRTPSRAGSWRNSSSRWQARSPARDAQTCGAGW